MQEQQSNHSEVLNSLEMIRATIEDTLAPFRKAFAETLIELTKTSLDSFEEKRNIAAIIQETADRLHVTFICNKCGHPARLRCSLAGTSTTGQFSFDHTIAGRRTNHGAGGNLPLLKITDLNK